MLQQTMRTFQGEQCDDVRYVFIENPCVNIHNCFIGDKVLSTFGAEIYGGSITANIDRLPSGVPIEYFIKQNIDVMYFLKKTWWV